MVNNTPPAYVYDQQSRSFRSLTNLHMWRSTSACAYNLILTCHVIVCSYVHSVCMYCLCIYIDCWLRSKRTGSCCNDPIRSLKKARIWLYADQSDPNDIKCAHCKHMSGFSRFMYTKAHVTTLSKCFSPFVQKFLRIGHFTAGPTMSWIVVHCVYISRLLMM